MKRQTPMASPRSKIVVFGGPSLPKSIHSSDVVIKPPAIFGDFDPLVGTDRTIVVLLDGGFLQNGAITHFELGRLLRSGVTVIGAASVGALRAAELRSFGMIGLGTVYNAILQGIVTDDAELAVGMCPVTFKSLTIPLINLRRFLFRALSDGISAASVEAAWRIAAEVYFLERTPTLLLERWDAGLTREICDYFSGCSLQSWDIKVADASDAIQYAERISAGEPLESMGSVLELFSDPLPPLRVLGK